MLTLAAVIITTLAAWPLVRLLGISGFRRRLRAYPSIAVGLPAALLTGFTGVVLLALTAPRLLHAGAAIVAIGIAWSAWRSRAAYGRDRNWPPGRLVLFRPDVWRDRRFYLREAARYGPVFKVCHVVHPMVCIADMRLGAEVLRQHEDDLVRVPLPYNRHIPKGFIRYMSADDRREYAPLLRAAFTTGVVDEAQLDFDAIANDALEAMAESSARAGPTGICPTAGLQQMVFDGMARAMIGVRPHDPTTGRLKRLCVALDHGSLWSARGMTRTLDDIVGILIEHSRSEARAGRSSFVSELEAIAPHALDDRTVVYNLAYLLVKGWRDTSGLFAWIVKTLGDHPEWRARVRDAFGRPDSDSDLPGRVVRETLRMHQSEYIQRRVQRDIRIGGFVAPGGWLLRVCVWEGHRSPAAFPDPDRFDPDRLLGEGYSRPSYAPFGAARTWCIGEHLTLALARTLVAGLARFDWTIAADGPPELGEFHWQPSSMLRINVAAATRAASVPSRAVPSTAC